MPSLTDLGPDILLPILSLLQATSPQTLHRSIALVNRQFRALARSIRFYTLDFDSSDDAHVHGLFSALEREHLWHTVRTIMVSRTAGSGPALDLLTTALPQMTGLRDLHIATNVIPAPLLDTLRTLPRIRLYAQVASSHRPRRPKPNTTPRETNLQRLRAHPNLHALDVEAMYYKAADCRLVTGPLREILLTCVNLRMLRLCIAQPSGGCVIYGPTPEYCGFGFVDGEAPPPLEVLLLEDYPFGHEDSPPPSPNSNPGSDDDGDVEDSYYSKENQIGYPAPGSEIDYWASTFTWSSLRRLRIYHTDMVLHPSMLHQLTSLREVEFTASLAAQRRFFASVPASLERIRTRRFIDVGLTGLMRHGASLNRLEMHCAEDWRSKWLEAALVLDVDCLSVIGGRCPHLVDLELDLAREGGEWPFEALEALASFPRLRTLTLWFELGVADGDHPVQPYVTFTSVDSLYKRMQGVREKLDLQPLRRLDVKAGAPPDVGRGLVAEEAFWPCYNSTAFRCVLGERDDEVAAGRYKIECTRLDERGNAILRQALESGEDPEEILDEEKWKGGQGGEGENVDREALRVAWYGPTPANQWEAHD
ncbi:hypothetical protein F5B20DRAFT_252816 [Whalleya microplaca]|nr:hypothetical protein F5B20DRAFT_252816 [Whalleya microplaca]